MTRLPDVFIIGAPKSGTTSLYEWLRGHPEIYMSPFKEPCYFARDLSWETSGYYLRYGADRERYTALFAEAGEAKRVGEASTRYLYSRDAPTLIAGEVPDARIVVVFRNPIDMIASLHAHKLASGTEDLAELEMALEAEEYRRAGHRIPANSNPLLSTYRERAMFGEQLTRWLDVFRRERVHVLVFEEMVRDPAAHYQALLAFLDVDPSYRPLSFATHNPAHGSRSKLLRSLARARPIQFLEWRLLPMAIGEARTLALSRSLVQSWLLRRRSTGKTEVPATLRVRLEGELTADVERLSGLLGRDLKSVWFSGGKR